MPRRDIVPLPTIAARAVAVLALAGALAAPRVATGQAASPVLTPPADAVAQVDKLFARYETTESPGCAVGVAVGGMPVLSRAYGMADIEQEQPASPETVFEAGSVSKQFTAAAVLLLAQQGKLSLDDPVRKYVPELPDYGRPITIRHALTHTSGLRDWGSVVAAAGWPRTSRVHTHAHVLDVASRQRALNFQPGSQFSYCNTGYNLAAILVSRVSGMPFAEFTRREIFEPLGMTRTTWRDDYTRIVKGRATAYAPVPGGWRIDMPFENVHGNGGLPTTVGDLLKWNENFVHAKVGGPAFVAAQQQQMRLNDGSEIEYAAGLYVTEFRGVREVSHSGSTAGYRAFLARYPEQGLSVAALCNAADANATRLAQQIAAIYLGDRARLAPRPRAITLDPEILSRRAGLYEDERTGGVLRLIAANGQLRLGGGRPLQPLTPTSFAMGDEGVRVEFTVDADQRATGFRVIVPRSRDERYVARRPVVPSASDLQAYVGRYTSEEAETELVAAVEGNTLVLRQRPDRVQALAPAWADVFTSPLGTVIFRRGVGGQVEALSLSGSRMYDLRFLRAEAATPSSAASP
jgi:CubicO group peptidase (beta-lactamase class C family)